MTIGEAQRLAADARLVEWIETRAVGKWTVTQALAQYRAYMGAARRGDKSTRELSAELATAANTAPLKTGACWLGKGQDRSGRAGPSEGSESRR